ncbi:MAG: hypothetical protein WBE58_06880 [Verrucomicrobiales bacterium]|nr:hypothetical protein [Verrucomicrobiales bacterium]
MKLTLQIVLILLSVGRVNAQSFPEIPHSGPMNQLEGAILCDNILILEGEIFMSSKTIAMPPDPTDPKDVTKTYCIGEIVVFNVKYCPANCVRDGRLASFGSLSKRVTLPVAYAIFNFASGSKIPMGNPKEPKGIFILSYDEALERYLLSFVNQPVESSLIKPLLLRRIEFEKRWLRAVEDSVRRAP